MTITQAMIQEIRQVIIGKDAVIRRILMAIFAGGHVLLEDVPGVGKTTLALTLSQVLGLDYRRIQFTPDVIPSDITGYTMYRKQDGAFVYVPGAAMCNLLLADEINRTSPKTQSSLLEVMAEGQMTVDGDTHPVPQPYCVIATQNPAGSSGTQPLPESQMDRFMVQLSLGYPDRDNEIAMLKARKAATDAKRVTTPEELLAIRKTVASLYTHDSLLAYMTDLIRATRTHPDIRLGVSPRGTLALAAMARASAFAEGRDYVVPADIQGVFADVCVHRIVLSGRAQAAHTDKRALLDAILSDVKAPSAV